MEKMSGHPRLYRRGATYYHRAAIPVDIQDTYSKTEETFSLKTKDRSEALKRVRVEAVRVDQLFEAHRRSRSQPRVKELSEAKIRQLADLYYAAQLEVDDDWRTSGMSDHEFTKYSETLDGVEKPMRDEYARGYIDPHIEFETNDLLSWEGVEINLDPKSESWRKLARAVQAASIRALEAHRARQNGQVVETPNREMLHSEHDSPLLSKAVDEWVSEKARTSWVPKTEHEHRVWTGHFIEIAGDKPVSQYGKSNGRAFKAVLMKLPANWNKLAPLKDLGVERAAKKADDLGLKPMSEKNLNKILGYVGSFWIWAERQFDNAPPNPFRGLKVKIGRKALGDRDPFTRDELQRIFSAPLYVGCKSLREWQHPGALIPRDSGIYWAPLLALFTGARAGEIIQLRVKDVREENGVPYFDVNVDGEDKRLKNAQSERRIPVHPELIQLGILDHVQERRRRGEERLFPDLKMGADGYYSSPFSKHFSRFLRLLGVKRSRNAFHSFRHCFEDACRNSGIPKEVMDALQGHKEQGMAASYGKGFGIAALADAMLKLRYDGLDLTHMCAANLLQKSERPSDQLRT